ncbi:MAG: ABC transporter permease [Rhodothalassiaceae bacterium]
MNLAASLMIALDALRANALRSLLTMLGIIIGVASVIVMVSVSSGASHEVERQIDSLGSNMLFVAPGSSRFGGRSAGGGTSAPFSERDMVALRERVPDIAAISGIVSTGAPVINGNVNWTTQIDGVHPDFLSIRNWQIASGRGLEDHDIRSAAKVAILGATTARELFGEGANPLGARIRIRNVPFEVIGTLVAKGQSGWGRDPDDVVIVPISTARRRLAGDAVVPNAIQTMVVGIVSSDRVSIAEREIEDAMRDIRRLAPGAAADFAVRNIAEFIRARRETQNTLGMLLGATAGIALIVGGIGIMNIMLVSVTERTKEIGLRMAIGARRRDIRTQFLIEATTLSMIGGLIGVGIGALGAALMAKMGNWPILIEPQFIALSLGASALVGIFFGFYPASRAARLNPIDALRFE